MKNPILSIFSSFVMAILIMNCTPNDEVSNSFDANQVKLDLADFKIYGQLHNQVMTETIKNFKFSDEGLTIEEKCQLIADFQKSIFDTLSSVPENLKGCSELFSVYKNLYLPAKTIDDLPLSTNSIYTTRAQDILLTTPSDVLSNTAILGVQEVQQIRKLSEVTNKCLNNLLNIDELEAEINSLVYDFYESNYVQGGDSGYVMAYALTIANASLDWWKNNSTELIMEMEAEGLDPIELGPVGLAHVVSADIGGAIYGSASAIITQAGVHLYNNGNLDDFEINWTTVGAGALGGALNGSIGISGRIGKWISNKFWSTAFNNHW